MWWRIDVSVVLLGIRHRDARRGIVFFSAPFKANARVRSAKLRKGFGVYVVDDTFSVRMMGRKKKKRKGNSVDDGKPRTERVSRVSRSDFSWAFAKPVSFSGGSTHLIAAQCGLYGAAASARVCRGPAAQTNLRQTQSDAKNGKTSFRVTVF